MKPLALLPLAALVWAGTALGGGTAAVTVKSAYVQPLGKPALVTRSGLTLYRNSAEKNGRIRCTGRCATAWPPLLVPTGARVVGAAGVVQAKLGTVRRPDGKLQATYAGSPLYRFAADARGQAKGQGLGGVWFAITLAGGSGSVPAPSPPAAPPPPPPAPGSGGYGGGYGYGS